MEGIIVNYRGSYKTQHPKQMIIKVKDVDTKEKAAKLVGKKVTWKTKTNKDISGKISAAHGNKGAVRAIFAEKGLPGQALGKKVIIS
ncbi:MAG: 50S ribosomal protein L35ae [Candidatus Woesearchaeota archaeon]|nr:MAG: 50S ribosomal protein L35ae [Candidatus Woesearchaeota archaeon]